jgi:hypothetical protein
MKILQLDPTYRTWLNARSALALDGDLNEKFTGLTHIDSIFYAEMTNEPLRDFDTWDVETLSRFLALYERHQLAVAFQGAVSQFIPR